jgi:membrane peptidoglycan carboxypeptidase
MQVEKMILVLEDRRFFRHNGIDMKACLRELVRVLTIQPHGGASTIDMQFVRTATNFREKTLRRKLYEMFLALLIQFRYNKKEILRSYLGCAYFGSHLYGLETVSYTLYGKSPIDLSFDEVAEVAAMLVYPKPLVATSQWRAKLARRANYGKRRYARFEKSFDKLPRFKTF